MTYRTLCSSLLLGAVLVHCGNGADATRAATDDAGGGVGGAINLDAAGDANLVEEASEASPDADAPGPTISCSPPIDLEQPIAKLSQTGCVDPSDPTKFAAAAVPYEVNSPLWSDSADKTRAFVLPAGKKIRIKDCFGIPTECDGPADDGKWVFPIGTVMIKNFLFDGKFVETRLFVRASESSWVGYGYRWDEAQTDATVVGFDRATVTFDTGKRKVSWHYPSRMDCMTCHNEAGGSTLGPETAQMNRVVGGTNQIDQFKSMDLFDRAPAPPYKPALGDSTTEQKARSYLHANCGFCHRPGGVLSTFDLRFDVPLAGTSTCNVAVTKSASGIDPLTTKLLAPGDVGRSAISIRMAQADPDSGRMPQIGSYVVDAPAVALVNEWIASLRDCR